MERRNIQIDQGELIRALTVIVDHLKAQRETSVFEILEDYYWEVSEQQLYDPTQDPSQFTLAQLSHDWECISQILTGDSPPIGYALVWLSALLRAIGQKHVA